jgi:vacuolar-type H+-ATPase subunit C/Vma6
MAKIPGFKTKEEERKFWETHSSADYWDATEEADDTFERPKLKSVSMKLDPEVLEKVRVLARKRGLSSSAMIRFLLSKGVENEFKSA